MIVDIKIPSPGESVTEVQLAQWLVKDGDIVEKDAELAMIDSDKASFAIYADESGKVKLLAKEGNTLKVAQVVCTINTDFAVEGQVNTKNIHRENNIETIENKEHSENNKIKITPLAKRMIKQMQLNPADVKVIAKGKKIKRADIDKYITGKKNIQTQSGNRNSRREKMSTLRLKLSQRLVNVKNRTAMLTTFNEINMSKMMGLRSRMKEEFKLKHNVSLGLVSFFAKASVIALKEFPMLNGFVDEDSIIFNDFIDIGIAVSTPKGLMVPVIKDAHNLSLTEIELKIHQLSEKTRNNKISIEELTGGTFTITNGGIFGSMLSTPILNPPQSAILGMHNIVDRPLAVNGKVEIHPVMYVALSYDHRIIDGRESVGFVIKVKNLIENPDELLDKNELDLLA